MSTSAGGQFEIRAIFWYDHLPLEDINVFVADPDIAPKMIELCIQRGIEVVIAE